jgi:VIT1/CCC1 family predicted Fe2+/Mn2+ transporter
VPLAPYFAFHDVRSALGASIAVTAVALTVFGWAKGRLTGVHPVRGALQTVLVGGIAAAAAFALARMLS